MKKLILALAAICIVAIAAVYFLIPQTLTVEESVKLPCVPSAAFRILSNEESWSKWWPAAAAEDAPKVSAKSWLFLNNRYSLSKKAGNNFEILVDNKKNILPSEMNLLSLPADSMLIRWHLNIHAGNSPFSRISEYRKALSLKKDMRTILNSIQTYLSDFKNVYGLTFHEGSIKDTFLITTKAYSAAWPSVDFVYSRISKLQAFCGTQGCSITGTPMLNITSISPGGYQVMVALPVNRFMQPKDSVSGVKMVPGKFIIADVTGGPQAIAHIHQQLHFYFQDYGRTSMAIPFDYLVTDRQKEKDTSKWKTRIYAPVY